MNDLMKIENVEYQRIKALSFSVEVSVEVSHWERKWKSQGQ